MMVSNSAGVKPPRAACQTSVLVALDLGHDRDSQLLAGGPALAVEDVFLQQCEDRFHSCAVAARCQLARRSGKSMAGQSAEKLWALKLDRFNRSLWTTQPATSPRIAAAFFSARTAGLDPILGSIKYPHDLVTKHPPLTAQRYSLPSPTLSR